MTLKSKASRFINCAIAQFEEIGLPFNVHSADVPDPPNSFFDGCWLESGCLHFVPERVKLSELLHEAGHLALIPKTNWHLIKPGTLDLLTPLTDYGVEAWDYAFAIKCGIPLLFLFVDGFNGNGFSVWEHFEGGTHPGIDLMELSGMADPFPKMTQWFVSEEAINLSAALEIDKIIMGDKMPEAT